MDFFIGKIMMWPGDWAPPGWEFCHGQEINISANTALYTVLQNRFGGKEGISFKLPDLRGRVPLGAGHADGLSNYTLGQSGGKEKVGLSIAEMPTHDHDAKIQVASPIERGTETNEAANNYLATGNNYASKANNSMSADVISVSETGQGTAHENRQPYITINYIICTSGVLPSRQK